MEGRLETRVTRGGFIGALTAFGAAGCVGGGASAGWRPDPSAQVFGELFHLATNMWSDYREGEYPDELIDRKSQRYYRLKFADTYYGEMTHYGLHRLAWAEVRRNRNRY